MFSKILVAYDGSELASKALEKVIELVKMNPLIELHVLFVKETPVPNYESEILEIVEIISEYKHEIIQKAEKQLSSIDNAYQTYVIKGQPVRVILEHVKKHNCDLIVIGGSSLSKVRKIFMGSVSHDVSQHSTVPVLLIK